MKELDNLKEERTIYVLNNNNNINYRQYYIGLLIYIVLFVIIIPYILIKNNLWLILSAYFPNLDLIASCLGYQGGPNNLDIWKFLYNPNNVSQLGYKSTMLINYISLIGIAFVIASHTLKTKNIYGGISIAIFIYPITYLLPNNIVIYLMNNFGNKINKINKYFTYNKLLHYIITVLYGLIISIGFIVLEGLCIHYFSKPLVDIFNKIYKL